MSSALAMVLMAAMVVPGNGAEKVSWEMEQGLDLSGEWEGTFGSKGGQAWTWNARLSSGILKCWDQQNRQRGQGQVRFVDKGGGKVSVGFGDKPLFFHHGTYKQESDLIVISYPVGPKKDRQIIITLRRVKPGK